MPCYDLKFKILNYGINSNSGKLLESIQKVVGVRKIYSLEQETGVCSLKIRQKDNNIFDDISNCIRCLGYDSKLLDLRLSANGNDKSSSEKNAVEFEELSFGSRTASDHVLLPDEDLGYKAARFSIKGLRCGSCASKVESNLRPVDGIISVKVSLMTGLASIKYHYSVISPADIVCIIATMGYGCEYICDDGMDLCVLNVVLPKINDSMLIKLYDVINKDRCVSWSQYDSSKNIFKIKYDLYWGKIRKFHKKLCEIVGTTVKFSRESSSDKLLKEFADTIALWKWMFIVSLLIGVPSMILMLVQMLLPRARMFYIFKGLSFINVIQFMLSLVAQIIVGKVFYGNSIKAARNKNVNMDTLISLASIISFLYSVAVVVYDMATMSSDSSHVFFETSQMLFLFVSLGRYLESIAKKHTLDSIECLSTLHPSDAILVHMPSEKFNACVFPPDKLSCCRESVIDINLIQLSDILRVPVGVRFPADGSIVVGSTSVDESLLTGEAYPRNKNIGAKVLSGTLNVGATTWIKVESCGPFTQAEGLVEAVTVAQNRKANIQGIADKICLYFVPTILLLSFVTLIVWLFVMFLTDTYNKYSAKEKIKYAFQTSISVLCVACPCALGLATPTAIMVASGIGAVHGILIKGGDVFQLLSKVDCIAFDKTGTLTIGQPVVVGHFLFEDAELDISLDVLWDIIYSIEISSIHPVAKAICEYTSRERSIKNCARLKHVYSSLGLGVDAYIAKEELKVFFRNPLNNDDLDSAWLHISLGNQPHMVEGNMVKPKHFETIVRKYEVLNESLVYISYDNRVVGFFRLKDSLRPETKRTLEILNSDNYQMLLVTGDTEISTSSIFYDMNIPNAYFSVYPSKKAEIVEDFQKNGFTVAFVGDGMNDSLAMATSDVGVSFTATVNLTADASDVILVNKNLLDLCNAINLAKVTMRRIKLNLFFSVVYNIIAVPIAAGCLKPFGLNVEPWMAAGAMAISSVSVVLSSLSLRMYKKKYVD